VAAVRELCSSSNPCYSARMDRHLAVTLQLPVPMKMLATRRNGGHVLEHGAAS
jgi:hypothetical protein